MNDRKAAGRTLRSALAALLTLICAAGFAGNAAADGAAVLHRGVGIVDAMNWATMDAAKKNYVFPPWSDKQHPLTVSELAIIKKAGFDFVRLAIDPGPLLQFQGAQLDGTYDVLRQRVQAILAANLSVIVDFHPAAQDPDYNTRSIEASASSPLFQAYCAMLTRTAKLLDPLPSNSVALELLNEPQLGGTPAGDAEWQAMGQTLYHCARAGSPKLTLVLTGDLSGLYNGLLNLDPTPFSGDPNTIFTFHFYLPDFFTSQSFPNIEDLRTAADIPYPALSRPIEDSVIALKERLETTNETDAQKSADMAREKKNLLLYRAANFGRKDIREDFDKIASWAKSHGIATSRILLGEFGAIRRYGRYFGGRDTEHARWLKDIREEAESHGFSWSVWGYRGYGGMVIVINDSTEELDPYSIGALGLH